MVHTIFNLVIGEESRSVQTIKAHDHEILTCDWNKYNEFIVMTGSVDKSIKIWVFDQKISRK